MPGGDPAYLDFVFSHIPAMFSVRSNSKKCPDSDPASNFNVLRLLLFLTGSSYESCIRPTWEDGSRIIRLPFAPSSTLLLITPSCSDNFPDSSVHREMEAARRQAMKDGRATGDLLARVYGTARGASPQPLGAPKGVVCFQRQGVRKARASSPLLSLSSDGRTIRMLLFGAK